MMKTQERPDPSQDGITHINTHSKTRHELGEILSPQYEIGEPIHHPFLGHFRSVENAWHYLNTGGERDRMRTSVPSDARYQAKLATKYKCDKFRELIRDLTIIKLRHDERWVKMMIDNELPFDHYFLRGSGKDRYATRPNHSDMFIGILDEVRDICRGIKPHEFVRFNEMNFTKVEEK